MLGKGEGRAEKHGAVEGDGAGATSDVDLRDERISEVHRAERVLLAFSKLTLGKRLTTDVISSPRFACVTSLPSCVPVALEPADTMLSALSVSPPSLAVPASVPLCNELLLVSTTPDSLPSVTFCSSKLGSPSSVGLMTLTPSIHSRRSCAFCRRFRTELIVIVAAPRRATPSGGGGAKELWAKPAVRREEVRREGGVGELEMGAEREAERRLEVVGMCRRFVEGVLTKESG